MDPWNRCDVCGRFIAMDDFDRGAVRQLVTPDSAYTSERYETLCVEHGKPKPLKCRLAKAVQVARVCSGAIHREA